MVEKELICIMCPMGCGLTVKQDGKKISVSGNSCARGVTFAVEEMTCPMRVLTTSVKTSKGVKSCKTNKPIPKSKIFQCMKEIEKLRLKDAKYGQVIIKNILNTGADIVITAND